MNVFVREIATDTVEAQPDQSPTKLVVEDNVGEAVHVHWRNVRLEMTIEDFLTFAENVATANEVLMNGDR
jgi:hypothetical protein